MSDPKPSTQAEVDAKWGAGSPESRLFQEFESRLRAEVAAEFAAERARRDTANLFIPGTNEDDAVPAKIKALVLGACAEGSKHESDGSER